MAAQIGDFLRESIVDRGVFYQNDLVGIFSSRESRFLVDLRELLLNPEFLDAVSDQFWSRYQGKACLQVAGLELACVPLITAIVLKGRQNGCRTNGLIVRKSRKKYGLEKTIEGEIRKDIDTVVHK